MKKLIKNTALTSDGADWLTLRLDPYHDFQRPICGYPDADCFDTIVSTLNYEFNVSHPAGSVGNWDAHVFTLPISSLTTDNGNSVNGQFTQTAEPYSLGLVNVAKDLAGGPLFPTAVPVASANFTLERVDSFDNVHEGLSRVIGLGIEIIDTTAELYKQGAMTAYRMPTNVQKSCDLGYLNTAGTHQAQIRSRILQAPPSTVAEAIAFHGSVQWEAKEGCYMAVGQEGVNNPFEMALRESVLVTGDPSLVGTDQALASRVQNLTALQVPPLVTASTGASTCKSVNTSQCGMIMSGLAEDATFKIRVRVYVERAPLVTDSALIPLATPSATYDSKALELYSQLVSSLPVAVPVCFNAKGDWWRWIVRTIGKIAGPVGSALTPILGPEAGLIGSGVAAAATAISNKADKRAAQRKKNRGIVQPARRIPNAQY